MVKESKVTKTSLVQVLINKGFSVRKARKAVNGLFDVIAEQLWLREIVPVPGGTLMVVSSKKQRTELHAFRNIQTKAVNYGMVRYNERHKTLKFTPTLKLELESEKEKRARLAPPPELPELTEIRLLASELLGRKMSDDDLERMVTVILRRSHRPDSLLNRLRELKTRVAPPIPPGELCQRLWDLWWI